MKIGIIDLGSNSIHLSIYQYDRKDFHLLRKEKLMAGILSYIREGKLSQEGLDKICDILCSYKKLLNKLEIYEVRCFSTAPLRLIEDKDTVLSTIKNQTGIDIDIISGNKEAKLDFIACKLSLDIHEGIVVDIGGGSAELVAFNEDEIIDTYSLAIGSLLLYKRCVKEIIPTKDELTKISEYIASELKKINHSSFASSKFKKAIGIGGTCRTLLRLINDSHKRKGQSLTTSELIELLDYLNTDKGIEKIQKVTPQRIHTIIPGAIILLEILKMASIKEVVISKYGIREGYLYNEVISKANHVAI